MRVLRLTPRQRSPNDGELVGISGTDDDSCYKNYEESCPHGKRTKRVRPVLKFPCRTAGSGLIVTQPLREEPINDYCPEGELSEPEHNDHTGEQSFTDHVASPS